MTLHDPPGPSVANGHVQCDRAISVQFGAPHPLRARQRANTTCDDRDYHISSPLLAAAPDRRYGAGAVSPGMRVPGEGAVRNSEDHGRRAVGRPEAPASPEEITGIVLDLCSDAASSVTGQTFVLDGGQTARRLFPQLS